MAMNEIQCINKNTVHQICSGQVIFDLSIAVKELVENSLDAGASSIDIKLKEYGLEQVEVVDNGCGVQENNFAALVMKHHTSKLQDFNDLSNVETFGFRGEALSSLCALCDVTICTKHVSNSVGHRIQYDHNGTITSLNAAARQTGTTVTLRNIFQSLPVRYKEFKKNIKKEYAKVLSLLSAYCIISTDVKISCSNQVAVRKQSCVLSTQGSSSIEQNISSVFGAKQLRTLKCFKQIKPLPEVCEEYHLHEQDVAESASSYSITGMISDAVHGNGRSAPDRQFYFVNSRPLELPRVAKVVNEVYHFHNRHQFPFVVLDVQTRRDDVDVNVTPDKRQVFLNNEKVLLCVIKSSLVTLYQQSHVVMPVTQPTIISTVSSRSTFGLLPTSGRARLSPCSDCHAAYNCFKGFLHVNESDPQSDGGQSVTCSTSSTCDEVHSKSGGPYPQRHEIHSPVKTDKSSFLSDQTLQSSFLSISKESNGPTTMHHPRRRFEEETQEKSSFSPLLSKFKRHNCSNDVGSARKRTSSNIFSGNIVAKQPRIDSVAQSTPDLKKSERDSKNSNCGPDFPSHIDFDERSDEDCVDRTSSDTSSQEETSRLLDNHVATSYQLVESEPTSCVVDEKEKFILDAPPEGLWEDRAVEELKFSMNRLKKLQASKEGRRRGERHMCGSASFRAKIETRQNENAEKELARNLKKDSFNEMIPLGQFNLGFIITKHGSDLFIIDQHASDEIYNFETLQKTTQLQLQNLVAPQKLDLSPSDQLVLKENMEIFQRNGFEFMNTFDEAEDKEACYLTKVPMSKNWQFGSRDVDELIFMLGDAPHVMCRPSRVREMFASRACRMSVMIGTALGKLEMSRLIKHMSEINHPWNCPHGRPTMRHLIDLSKISTESLS